MKTIHIAFTLSRGIFLISAILYTAIFLGIIYLLYLVIYPAYLLRKHALKYKLRLVIGIIAAFLILPKAIGLLMFGVQSALPNQPLKVVDTTPNADSNDKVAIKGKTKPNASVNISDDTAKVDQDTHANSSGNFQFKNLSAEKTYDISLNYWDSTPESIRISPNNKEITKFEKADQKKTKSHNTDTIDITNKKNGQDAINGFTDDMDAYLNNKYPEISFTYDNKNKIAQFIVPNKTASMNKSEKKNYINPINDRVGLFANAENLDIPTIQVKTQNGTKIARSGILGVKVYR